MNCQNCGANVDGKAFCPQCGTPVAQQAQAPVYQAPPSNAIPQQQQTVGNPTKVLVFGIIGLALCEMGIVGLIFSIIGLVQANSYIATYGDIANQVRIGKRLSIAGLIVSIVMIVVWVFIIIGIVSAATYASQYGYSYYYRYY